MLTKLEKIDKQFAVSLIYLVLFIPMVWYILIRWGDRIEILTLLIGFVVGRVTAVDGVYLGSTMNKKPEPPGITTGTSTTRTELTTTVPDPTDKTTQP